MFGFKLARRGSDLDRQYRVEKLVNKIAENIPFRTIAQKKVVAGVLIGEHEALAVTRSEFENLRDYLMAMREDEKRIKGE